ncbi:MULTISPECIES: sigma-54 dependent transcriptional regulator [unclassified Novosphingobium]|uniref:sigma-54-dependent transcriptional regulator n=1 Tax=unclassified Novosphingobium TaxID=2644732 RepID=UPI00146D70E8|nr:MULTISPECIES: sigma-54 dependent transcriptional regulator [unclassified Novosphingobium]NMN05378.1 two-component system C4-dicarboxylate transport response regulator DctD [Novosphingobium sp. SG919]NMN87673.1 two-component system C4-dicarboxylate transport response regulator DctD [Novosphingobium sp. SG916]
MTEATRHIALVEDDADLRASTAQLLRLADFQVREFADAPAALAALDATWPGVVISDVRMPGLSGIDLFRALRARDEELPVILITGHGDVDMAVDALKAGVWDFLTKPFAAEALIAAAERAAHARALALENRRLQAQAQDGAAAAALIGTSPAIRRLRDMIPTLADADLDLLIEGETGTGKELLARLIHQGGKRRRHRFATVNCAGLGPALEDEILSLSGGASLVHASRGTLLLDDIDGASPRFHSLLVPVLEDRALAVPGKDAVPLDLRVIATAGSADALPPALLHRLAGMRIAIPPLRARREDIPALFAHFAGEAAVRAKLPVPRLMPAVQDRLERHDWPGNAHELARFAQQWVLGLVTPELPAAPGETPLSLAERVDAFERAEIIAAVRAAQGRIATAIATLGLPRKTFYYKVNKLQIDLQALRQV